jgi:hypothetical protein
MDVSGHLERPPIVRPILSDTSRSTVLRESEKPLSLSFEATRHALPDARRIVGIEANLFWFVLSVF